MSSALVFEGRCWKLGDNIPTDAIIPTRALVPGAGSIRKHVLVGVRPEFPENVKPGDIVCAGRNFGCSSGRAMAPKALKAVGVSVVLAETFSRTFYRNGHEVGLPILEIGGIGALVSDGDRLRVDVETAWVENLATGASIRGTPPPEFLLKMMKAGGIIPLLLSGDPTVRHIGKIRRDASSQ